MTSRGFSAIFVIGLMLILSLGAGLFISLNKDKNSNFKQNTNTLQEITPEPTVASSSASPSTNPKKIISTSAPKPTTTSSKVSPSPTLSPTPQSKTITVSGFAYEDRTNDGLFNSDDPKLPYMQLLIYDSATDEWINSIYTNQDGTFTVTNTVKGNLVIKPGCNDNFCPKDGSRTFTSSSTNQQFAFRSGSAPTGSNNGVIEGDLIIEGNRQYKFYLLDKNNNYYTNIEWIGGHFKAQNLPTDRTYIIRISYGDSSPDNTEITLSSASPEKRTLQIRVR